MKGQFELYHGGVIRRGWRWRYRTRNGRIIFVSSECYRNKADALRSIEIVREASGAAVEEEE